MIPFSEISIVLSSHSTLEALRQEGQGGPRGNPEGKIAPTKD